MKTKKRILVAPLDWGIGHATRCIPVIENLILHGFEVILAADGRPLHLLNSEFPNLEMIRLGGYNIRYSNHFPMSINMMIQLPKIYLSIKKEKKIIEGIIKDYKIDGLISDNRYGLYSNQIPSVFITHQLQVQSPFLKDTIQKLNYKYIHRFDANWIIDDKSINLAGELSKPEILPKNSIYIGLQSRLKEGSVDKKYDFLGIISGPEPQRTVLEKGLIKALKDRQEKSLLLLGKPELNSHKIIENLTIKSHLKATELNNAILESELIICRPGYSTIMDIAKLRKKAFFIPTPGQTEQEYLAKKLKKDKISYYQQQSKFNFDKAIIESKNYSGFKSQDWQITNWHELFSLFKNK
jgi:uncharacterized protein (TIGR00661 family)|tara:strand:- start:1426 stop:2484 length:1059 start_codon:yes stop_codon:yes gene_type:complete